MGFFDDINPVKVVSNAVNEVSKGVSNVTKEVSRGIDNIGRSDIGKVIEATTAPARGGIRIAENLLKGNFQGAAGAAVYTIDSASPLTMAANSSRSVRDLMKHNTVNTLTLGYSRDQADIAERGMQVSYGRVVDATDWSTLGRQGIRTAAMAGAVIGAPVAYGAAKSTLSGVTLSGALQGAGGAASVYKAIERGDYGAVADALVPGSGDLVRGITTPGAPSAPGRAPASTTTQNPVVLNSGGISTQTMLLIGGGLLTLIAAAVIVKRG